MHTTQFNHAPGQIFMNTGSQVIGRPSIGSWLTYGLGSESKDLPGFVVLLSGENAPDGGKSCWGSGFLPTVYQGVEFRSKGDPVLFVSNPDGVDRGARRESIDLVSRPEPRASRRRGRSRDRHAHRGLRDGVPDADQRAGADRHLEGADRRFTSCTAPQPGKVSFANNCLLARRLVERGVRFVQLYHRGWDTHGASVGNDIATKVPELCRETDRAATALVHDLKQRGLLDDTLVVWGGEFGRTPMNEARNGSQAAGARPSSARVHDLDGRRRRQAGHHDRPTDDLGYNVVEDPVDVHDLHATILHLMGLDHTKLTYKFQGREFRLTDVRRQRRPEAAGVGGRRRECAQSAGASSAAAT